MNLTRLALVLSICLLATSDTTWKFEGDAESNLLGHRVVGNLRAFLARPTVLAIQINEAFQSGYFRDQPNKIRQLLYLQARASDPFMSLIYIAFPNGTFFGYEYGKGSGDLYYASSLGINSTCPDQNFASPCLAISATDPSGSPAPPTRFVGRFEASSLPGFAQVQQTLATAWSPIFVSSDARLAMTFSAPLVQNNSLVAVVGVQVDLKFLENFLVKEYQDRDSIVFIVDTATDMLIASSLANCSLSWVNHELSQLPAVMSGVPRIEAAYQLLLAQSKRDGFVYINSKMFVESIAFTPQADQPQVEWRVVTARAVSVEPTSFVESGSLLGVVLYGQATLVGVLTLFFFVFIGLSRHRKIWRLALPPTLVVIMMGGICACLTNILLVGPNTKSICVARFWLVPLTLAVTTFGLLAKVTHLCVVAGTAEKMTSVTIRSVQMLRVLVWPCVALVLILVVSTALDPAGPRSVFGETHAAVVQTVVCGTGTIYPDLAVFALLLVVFIRGSWLSYRSRHLSGTLIESRTIMFTFYQGFVIFVLMYGITALSISPDKIAVVWGTCLFWYTASTQVVVLLPRVYYQLTHNNDITQTQEESDIGSPEPMVARAFFPTHKRGMASPATVDELNTKHALGTDSTDELIPGIAVNSPA